MGKVEYKNKTIKFEKSPNPKVSLDGESIQVSHDADANEFTSAELPYQSFKSVKKLAKAVSKRRLQSE